MNKPTCYGGSEMALRDSRHGRFWGCRNYPTCDGIIGCHSDGSPLGTPADKGTRQMRQLAHEAFDNWWPTMKMTRGEAYEWLEENGPKGHIAEMDFEECGELIKTLEKDDDR